MPMSVTAAKALKSASLDPFLAAAKLAKQSYGIKCAQTRFGGPRGLWLECTSCDNSEVIVGSKPADGEWARRPDSDAVIVFQMHGWTGDGPRMLKAKCPTCSSASTTESPSQ